MKKYRQLKNLIRFMIILSLVFVIGSNTYTYSLQNGDLVVDESPAGTQDQLNSFNTNITNLDFQRLSDNSGSIDSIIINFTLESEALRTGGSPESESFRTTIGTR